MKTIKVGKKRIACVDDEDFDALNRYRWTPTIGRSGIVYAYRREGRKTFLMHRIIMKARRDEIVDHVDGDGLNNVKKNLRTCPHQENIRNRRGPTRRSRSGVLGVSATTRNKTNPWRATIYVNGKQVLVGTFKTLKEASAARRIAEKKYFKEFAPKHLYES